MKKARKTVTKTTENSDVTTSGRYLKMWHEVKPGKFRPVTHRFEAVDNKFELEIEKNNKMDTTKINIHYLSKDGPKVFSVGAYTKKLGKVWVGVPELENDKNKTIQTH